MRNNENNIIFNVRNITLNLKNITTYFTGKAKIITLVSIIIMLSFINIILCSSDIFYNSNVSALTYQTSTNIGFTFLPTLNVSLSSNNLTINNLVPGGNAEDSNTITVNVSTNIAEGYNLYATVGSDSSSGNNSNNDNNNNNTTNSNGYNTANLVSTVDNNYVFTPLSSNISELANFTNNNWGYSYSLDSGATWISGDYDNASTGYNGLPLYTDTGIKLVEEVDNTSSTVDFKIAAKAGSTQPSGEYTNVINFTVVSNTIPTTMLDAFIASGAQMYKGYFKMQDMTPTICKSIDTDGEKGMQLIDVRDDKVYWVAKLKDNNCWMTQNLDLDLSSSVALTSETSDINPESYGTTIYTTDTGYSKDETTGVVSWLPGTIDGEGIQRADTIDMVWSSNTAATVPGWTNDNNKPYSADAGDRYRYTDSSGNEAVYASFDACLTGTNNDKVGCQHAHLGNYYNWSTVIASNNTSNVTDTQVNSICPKRWNVPTPTKYDSMLKMQKIIAGFNYDTNGFLNIRIFPLYLVRSGSIVGETLSFFGNRGRYWSSKIMDSASAYYLVFHASGINSTSYDRNYGRGYGFSVRCMVDSN